jgi:hypothetical protein
MPKANRAVFGFIGNFPPGAQHEWRMIGFAPGDPIFVTAHPVVGNPFDLHRVLAVDNLRVDGVPNGAASLVARVRNVGTTNVPGYSLGFGWISR